MVLETEFTTDEGAVMRDKRMFVTCRVDDDINYLLRWAGKGALMAGTDLGHDDFSRDIFAFRTLRESGLYDRETVDGIVGPQTWSRLPADPQTPLLSRGATGAAVSALQKGLKLYAGQNPAADPGSVDGDFGPRTEAAVKAYQSDRGVSVDGVVGDRTWWVPAGAAGATLASLSGVTTA